MEIVDVIIDLVTTMIPSFSGIVITGFIDAIIWLFHSALLKPLAQELVGSFMINESMLHESSYEIVGLILNYCYRKMLIIGFSILMLIAMWQLFKSFFSYFGETQSEEGWRIGLKVIMYGILTLNAKSICEQVIKLATGIMEGIGNISVAMNSSKDQIAGTLVPSIIENAGNSVGNLVGINNFGGTLANNMGFSTQTLAQTVGSTMKEAISNIYFVLENGEFAPTVSLSKLLQFIMIILIDVKLVKFAINMAEKYMNVVLMIIISPVAFACGVSKSTSNILKKWVSLFTSGVLYQLFQYLVIAMLYYIVTHTGDANIFKVLLIIWSVLSMAENADSLVDELGFSSLGRGATGIMGMTKALNHIPLPNADFYQPDKKNQASNGGNGNSNVQINNNT